MNNLQIQTIAFSQNGYSKVTYKVKGSLSSNAALEMKNTMDSWFSSKASECIIDLSEAEELDIVGINLLVRMKMKASMDRTVFYVKAPYISEIVETFEQTKMTQPLNVVYDIRNSLRMAS